MKGCSHVTCKTCTDTLVRPSNQCVVCDKLLAEGDILELKREGWFLLNPYGYRFFSESFPGTGYAGGGMAETRKQGVAFQG
jgi:nitric oxide synthase-interacting protein